MKKKILVIVILIAIPLIILIWGMLKTGYFLLKDYIDVKQKYALAIKPQLEMETELWSLVKNYRRLNDNPVVENQFLCDLAFSRAREANENWDDEHGKFYARFNSPSYTKYLKQSYYINENLASEIPFAQDAMTGWLNSPGHKENLDDGTTTEGCLRCYGYTCSLILGTTQ